MLSILAFDYIGSPLAGWTGTLWGTLANFLLIQGWIPGHPEVRQAWNGVSWTLSCELMFYLAAPFAFRALLASKKSWLPLAVVGLLWGFLFAMNCIATDRQWVGWLDFAQYYPAPRFVEFLAGACGALMVRRGWNRPSVRLSLLLMALPLAAYCVLCPEAGGFRSAAVQIGLLVPGTLWLVMSLARGDIAGKTRWMSVKPLVFFGEASFALYMVHALLLGLFFYYKPLFFSWADKSVGGGELLTFIFLLTALAMSSLFHAMVESPARAYLSRRYISKL